MSDRRSTRRPNGMSEKMSDRMPKMPERMITCQSNKMPIQM